MDKPVETRHGPYTIKAAILHGSATARAFVTGGKAGTVAQAVPRDGAMPASQVNSSAG